MPRASSTGTTGLFKRHFGCGNTGGAATKCDCAWRAKYGGHDVHLAKWARVAVDPRTKGKAIEILNRVRTAVDDKVFDPAGERAADGTGQRLADLIAEYRTHHIEKHDLTDTSILDVIARGRLGAMTLEDLATGTAAIQDWLDITMRERKWLPGTWAAYRRQLRAVCRKAIKWKRLKADPTQNLEAPRGAKRQRQFRNHRPLEQPDVEQRLFAACDVLDRPKVHRHKLTQVIADRIRARINAGETQKAVAADVGVSRAVVCDIVQGKIWNPARYVPSTKGAEMRRRLMAAFDTGLRAGEIILVQVQHVVWSRPVPLVDADTGTAFHGYEIVLPPDVSKGGKTTEADESVLVASLRLSRELEARRFALKNTPTGYLFGTETGGAVKGFRRLWRRVFTEAFGRGNWGRALGLTWHTTRHEFISRVIDTSNGNAVAGQEAARHKDLRTTERYIHVGFSRKWSAVAGANGAEPTSGRVAVGLQSGKCASS